jgi:hypothetical protein
MLVYLALQDIPIIQIITHAQARLILVLAQAHHLIHLHLLIQIPQLLLQAALQEHIGMV